MNNKYILIILAFLLSSTLFSQEFYLSPLSFTKQLAVATNEPDVKTTVEPAMKVISPSVMQYLRVNKPSDFNIHIPPGEAIILQHHSENNYIHQFAIHHYDSLTVLAKQAINKAPLWLRCDLRDLLAQLNRNYQDKWAKCILDTKDPYVDEVAFSIANLSPEYLSSTYAYPEMFRINAEYIYRYDSLFSYVKIVDYGNSQSGGNYYSTARYKEMDSNGHIYENEIPYEVYYWYVVHPKITDETPGFVNPTKIEDNPNVNLTTPDKGKFWREYVLEHGDAGIPNENFGTYQDYVDTNSHITAKPFTSEYNYKGLALHILDTLKTISYIWDDTVIHNMATCYRKDHVMSTLNRYVGSTMHFWSTPQERPHQPVRILKWGVGRCGEHEDLTAAVGRTALIPSAGIEAVSSDHVWNVYYFDGKWWPWEPVNGFVGRDFPDGNGNRWASVNHRRSDGVTEMDVAKDYSTQTAIIKVKVTDKKNLPIDGAGVVLYAKQASGTSLYYDNVRNTDHSGIAEFEVGNGRVYYAKVYALGQEKPTGNYVTAVTSDLPVDSGKIYSSTFKFTTIALPVFAPGVMDTVTVENTDTTLIFDIETQDEIVYGRSLADDLGNLQVREHRKTNPSLSFFRLNDDNFSKFMADTTFKAYQVKNNMISTDTTFHVGKNINSYFIIRNNYRQDYVYLRGEVVFSNKDTSISLPLDVNDTIFRFPGKKIIQQEPIIYPNPSNGSFTLELADIDKANIDIFDVLGRVVSFNKIIVNTVKTNLDLKGLKDGLYNIVIKTENNTFRKKIIIAGSKY